MIVVDLSKQQALDSDLKAIQQINLNLHRNLKIYKFIQIEQEVHDSISFLKKRKKLSQTFRKEV